MTTDNILKLNHATLSTLLKNKLMDIINPQTYEIKEVLIKDNGLVLTIDYFYIPNEKPEVAEIHIKDISKYFDNKNVQLDFEIEEK